MKRDFLKISDQSAPEIRRLIDRAIDLKAGKDGPRCPLIGRSIGLLFEKSSTRTRVSFEVGIYQLGAQPIALNASESQLARGETIADTSRVLSRYLHAVVVRTFGHDRLEEFAANASVPVINGLSDLHHPCQILADLMTIRERKGELTGMRVAYVGDGNNVANSLIEAAALLGFELRLACPEGFEPSYEVIDGARANGGGDNIILLRHPREAAGMADVVYTDVWVSMGQEAASEEKRKKLRGYQVNAALLSCAKSNVSVLHCLPAHRGEEITDDVLDGPHSAVLDQAENRLHVQKALLEFLLV
ncbi:MAG: ornithine carbamoyltransferase [Thermodesulfovibrionales bacterium]